MAERNVIKLFRLIMSNYPLGAENDPRAPWNQEDLTPKIESLTEAVRSDCANLLPSLIWEWINDNCDADDGEREVIMEEVYDGIMFDVRQIWEN